MNLNIGSIASPDLPSLLEQVKSDVLTTTNCHRVGTIQSFNASAQTATVTINQQAIVGSEVKDFPLLVDVPVFVMTGGATGVITMPVQAGDTCLVLFHDRDLDNWFATGNTTTPNTPRLHSLSDGMAIVGFRSKANPVSNYSTTAIEVRNFGSKISVGVPVEILAAGDVLVENGEGTAISLEDKIAVSNTVTDLKTVLDLMMFAVATVNAIKTGGDANTQIVAAQNAIATLLKTP